ncbi:MAG TPA: hypothetical protein VHY33_11510 [Thermoanaerobaculia bacterium]|jgi:hypothetical protein|nr:hypothetical protein [Thermoanaerobaculia bacterium]
MRKTALLLCLVAGSLFGAEVRVDQPVAPVQLGAAPARQEWARVASGGTTFFAVWRTRTASKVVIGGGRISPDGALLDRPSILIASGTTATLGYPDVIFVGERFLVVYQSGTSILTRCFSRDGEPVDPQPQVIRNAAVFAPLATNGKNVFLATARDHFLLLAPNGSPLGAGHTIPNAGSGSMSIASNGDRYLIAYTNAPDGSLHGTFVTVDADGGFLLSRPIQLPDDLFPRSVTATSNGSSFLIAMATNGPVGCVFVDGAGNAGALRRLDSQPGHGVAASWTGSEYTLAWPRTLSTATSVSGHDIVAARVDAAGVPLDTTPYVIASMQNGRYGAAFASAWNGQDTIVITSDDDGDFSDWHTRGTIFKSLPQLDSEPAKRRRFPIASSAAEQAGASIASNGTLSLVAWRESTGLDQAVVRAAFIAADGQLGAPIDLGEAGSQTTTATASNGRDFLVSYHDTLYRLVARRVTLEGVLDPTPIVLHLYGTPTDAMAAAWSGQAYVVAEGGNTVTVSSVTADGAPVIWRRVSDVANPDTVAIACAEGGCDVTWHIADFQCVVLCASPGPNDAFERTDPLGNHISQVPLASAETPALSIPLTKATSLFVYSIGKSMFAGRITEAGVVLDPPQINGGKLIMTSETAFALQPLAVVYGGLYFIEPDSDAAGRLYWTRIDPAPTPRVTSLINLHETVTLPVTITASARNTYAVYSRGEEDATLMAPRLFLRTLASPDPQTSPVRRHAAR